MRRQWSGLCGAGRQGDGPRFKGRGLLHLTGRWNYSRLSPRQGRRASRHQARKHFRYQARPRDKRLAERSKSESQVGRLPEPPAAKTTPFQASASRASTCTPSNLGVTSATCAPATDNAASNRRLQVTNNCTPKTFLPYSNSIMESSPKGKAIRAKLTIRRATRQASKIPSCVMRNKFAAYSAS